MEHLLERAVPGKMGIAPEKLTELYEFFSEPRLGLHSFLALRHGKVITEGYWTPYAAEKPHTLFSASKTFTGLAVGFAVRDGLLSVNDRVVDWFRDRLPAKTCENMEKMTVRHLLMMSTGFAKDPHDFPWPRPDDINGTGPHCCHNGVEIPQIDWIRNFFDHYVPYEPGEGFAYCTHASYMLSVIVQKAVGKTVSEYLNEKLFTPMGIGRPSWELSPDGYSTGGWGLMLTTEQLAAVGQMLLQKGSWKGKELLPEEWVREATSVQITLDHLKEPHTAGYGYQLWVDGREGCFLFKGAFGQICAVIPGKDMVIAYTGGIASDDREKIWDRIWKLLVEPAKEEEISWTEEEENRLTKLISSLAVPTPAGKPSWEEAQAVLYSKKKYLLGDNRLNLTSLSMKFAADPSENDELTLALSGKEFTVPVGYGTWLEGKTCVTTDETDTDVSVIFEHVACAGAWKEGKYRLILCFDETSYHNTMELTFSRGGLLVNHSRNLSFYPGVNAFLTGAEAPEERKEQLPGDIDINTKLITLLGTPLGQSFAARMQNRGYEAAGLNMRYFYTEMDSRHLGDVVNGIRYMNFAGFAVTKPNKVEILQYLDELDPLCRKMGSCNTVVKTEDGKLVGYNTDGIGFFTSLTEEGVKVEGGSFFCIGSGGAGRAICSVLAYKGAKTIYITDKSEGSAKALVEDINENFAPVAVFVPQGTFSKLPECSVIINASGVGMGSSMGTSPLPKEAVCEGPLYFDACYNPDKTQFLLDAEEKGCRILNGLGMSLYQGAAQIELWTGKKAPVDAMRQELLKILKQ